VWPAGGGDQPTVPQPPFAGPPPPYAGAPQPAYAGPPPSSGAGFPPPPWAQPPGPGAPHPHPHRRAGRVGRVAAIGAAALVLAAGSGLFGGWVATQRDDDARVPPRPAAAAVPAIDRSSLAAIAEAVLPSVVSIATGRSEGSGVVLSADGFILTNNHVVAGATDGAVTVAFSNGKTAQAKVVGTDPPSDLGVVKAEGVTDLRPAKFGDSSAMRVGDTVLAVGSPLGLQGSVTAGIVSALDRTIRAGGEQQSPLEQPGTVRQMSGLLQTDAPINPGNSGGALVNTNGQVIGINTAIATSGQGQGNIGVGFALPSNKASFVAEKLQKGEKVSHAFLGVEVTNAETGGALIGSIQPGSPAARAGLQRGDVVRQFGDKQINDSDDLVSAVQTGKSGDRLSVTYVRNGEDRTTTVTLGEAS
jgi:putative serine protease PepD